MADVHALLIAVESYQDAAVPAVPHAEAGAKALAEVLRAQGVAETNLTLLINAAATKTVIESRIRQYAKKLPAGDSLLVVFVGNVVSEAGQNYLLASDAVADDLTGTGVPLADLWDRLAGGKASFVVFLDAGAMTAPPADLDESADPHLASDELGELSDKGVLFAASTDDEPSAADGSRRVWLDLVREAFAGRAVGEKVTASALAEYLPRELPRAIRKTLSNPVRQTPAAYHADDRLILGVKPMESAASAAPGVDLEQLKRVAFRAETTQRFKSLSGFQKGNKVPDQSNAWGNKFLAKLATTDIRSDIEEIYAAIREHLAFKRKDLEASTENDGSGFIRTPMFDYTIAARLDPADPSTVIWRREVSNLQDPEIVQGSAFGAVFGNTFDRLVFEFATPLDVAGLVDRIEDEAPAGVKVRLSSDESVCTITLVGFAGGITIDRETLQIEGRQSQTTATLIQQFFEFQRRFASSLDLKQLPLKKAE